MINQKSKVIRKLEEEMKRAINAKDEPVANAFAKAIMIVEGRA